MFNSFRSQTWSVVCFMMLVSASDAFSGQSTFFAKDDPKGTLTNTTASFNSFVASLSSYGVNDLESFAGFSTDPTLTFGATGISAQTDFNNVAAFASLAVSGNNSLLDAGPSAAGGTAINDTMLFNKPITALGFFISNGGDATTANALSLLVENTLTLTSKIVPVATLGPSAGFNNVVFFGLTDTDPLNKVTVIETFDFDGLLFDNITAGYVAIPEVSSFGMAAFALWACCMGAYLRHTKNKE
jgi:hypothetical protein